MESQLLALALLAALLVTVRVAPEAEAAGRKAVLDTAYVCDFGQGSGVIDVTVKVRLPRKAAAGSTLAQRRIKVSLVLPADTVASLRQFGVESVEGRADRARLRVGPARPAVRGLRVPRTDLPESGWPSSSPPTATAPPSSRAWRARWRRGPRAGWGRCG